MVKIGPVELPTSVWIVMPCGDARCGDELNATVSCSLREHPVRLVDEGHSVAWGSGTTGLIPSVFAHTKVVSREGARDVPARIYRMCRTANCGDPTDPGGRVLSKFIDGMVRATAAWSRPLIGSEMSHFLESSTATGAEWEAGVALLTKSLEGVVFERREHRPA
jgi:hypothetical protein